MRKLSILILGIISIPLACVTVYAKTYQYRCPKCDLVLTYERPGIVKCPNDGSSMIPKW